MTVVPFTPQAYGEFVDALPQAAWRRPYSRQRGDWVLGKRYRITKNLLSDAAAAIAPSGAGDLNSSPRAA